MSYVNMDHAKWVEENNLAGKRIHFNKKGKLADYWRTVPEVLSPFHVRVIDILGMTFGGIYNAPINWESVDWHFGGGLSVVLTHRISLATFDFDRLTRLVFLSHEARIRCEVEPGGFRSFRLSFWQRQPSGSMSQRHPNLDEAVTIFRQYLPSDHRIVYRDDQTERQA